MDAESSVLLSGPVLSAAKCPAIAPFAERSLGLLLFLADRHALTLLLTGLRPGELVHLLLPDDLDLETAWLQVRNKPELGWQIKTRNGRDIRVVAVAVAWGMERSELLWFAREDGLPYISEAGRLGANAFRLRS